MQVNFRDQDEPWFDKQLEAVWKKYRTGTYSQKELAEVFNLGVGRVAKIVRCDPDAPKRATKTVDQFLGARKSGRTRRKSG